MPPTSRPRVHHKRNQHVPWCPNTDLNKNVFSFLWNKSVDCSSFRSVSSLFHARGATTEKALSPIRRHVRCMTRLLPHDEARSADRAGISATGVSKSEVYSGMCPRSSMWTNKHSLYWILSVTGNQCNSWRAGVSCSCGLRFRIVRAAACRTRWNPVVIFWGTWPVME